MLGIIFVSVVGQTSRDDQIEEDDDDSDAIETGWVFLITDPDEGLDCWFIIGFSVFCCGDVSIGCCLCL